MDRIRVSETRDTGSTPVGATKNKTYCTFSTVNFKWLLSSMDTRPTEHVSRSDGEFEFPKLAIQVRLL